MSKYGKIINGKLSIGIPSVYKKPDGRFVSNYDLQDPLMWKVDGFKFIIRVLPALEALQEYSGYSVEEKDSEIILTYNVVDKIPAIIDVDIKESIVTTSGILQTQIDDIKKTIPTALIIAARNDLQNQINNIKAYGIGLQTQINQIKNAGLARKTYVDSAIISSSGDIQLDIDTVSNSLGVVTSNFIGVKNNLQGQIDDINLPIEFVASGNLQNQIDEVKNSIPSVPDIPTEFAASGHLQNQLDTIKTILKDEYGINLL